MSNNTSVTTTVFLALPAYNESAVISGLIESAAKVFSSAAMPFHIVVVDDGSSDDTFAIVKDLSKRYPLTVERHAVNMNLGPTIRDALRTASDKAADDDVIVTMDADGTQPLELIPRMIGLIEKGCDVVIASRYQKGAQVIGVPPVRQLTSIGASVLFRILFPIRNVRDYTCGFRAYRASVIKKAFTQLGDRFVDQTGFQCMVDILIKLGRFRCSFAEVPMVLRYDLKKGQSKMKVMRTVLKTLGLLAKRKFGR
jgi:dolichol-phosphate mannosyltransferase